MWHFLVLPFLIVGIEWPEKLAFIKTIILDLTIKTKPAESDNNLLRTSVVHAILFASNLKASLWS